MLEIKIYGKPKIRLVKKKPDDYLGGESMDLSFGKPVKVEINGQPYIAKTITYNRWNGREDLWVLQNGLFKFVYDLKDLK